MVFPRYLEEVEEVCCCGVDFYKDYTSGRFSINGPSEEEGFGSGTSETLSSCGPYTLVKNFSQWRHLNVFCDLDCFHLLIGMTRRFSAGTMSFVPNLRGFFRLNYWSRGIGDIVL